RRPHRETLAPLPSRAKIDVHEARARIVAKAKEADGSGGSLEGDRIVVGHGDVEGRAVHVLRARRAADGPVVRRTAVGRTDDERLAKPIAQRLELVERFLVYTQGAAAPAGDLSGGKILPAPRALGHVAPVFVSHGRHRRSPGTKKPAPRRGRAVV